jgi:DNA-binding NtrC family response regulator
MKEKQKYILLVEDESDLVDLFIEQWNEYPLIKIQSSDNLSDAVQRSQRQKYDLIMVDIKIKKGLGSDLILKIRKQENFPNFQTPIIVASGHLDQEIIKQIKQHIQGAYVKPYDYAKLKEHILKILQIH